MDSWRIEGIFVKYGIILAYLFGSQKDEAIAFLNGKDYKVDTQSDLDIAVFFERPPHDVFDTYGNLYASLSEIFSPFDIDIVFMHELGNLFLYEIISGYRLYSRDDNFAEDYEERIMKLASDLRFKKKEFDRDVLEAMKDGYFEIKT